MKISTHLLVAALVLVALVPSAQAAQTHVIQQLSLTFDPADINITVGDTVSWEWTALSHTVTSGTGAADPEVGALFDAPLNAANPTFTFVFTEAGVVPFFCRPHELAGMTGSVTVEEDVTGVESTPSAVAGLRSYPNPFNPQTTLAFDLPRAGAVTVRIFDARGQSLRTLLQGHRDAGEHRLVWDGTTDDGLPLASGVYFARLDGPRFREVHKLVLSK